MALKVALADSNLLFVSLLKGWILTEPALKFVGATDSGSKIEELVKRGRPDILLMDPMLPDACGFDIAKGLRERMPHLVLIAMYHCSRPYMADRLHDSGFQGCVSKRSNSIEAIKAAIANTSAGKAYNCAETCRIQNELYNDPKSFVRLLSSREQEVLSLIGAGMDNDEIGRRLGLSTATVQTHRRNLFRKLDIHDTPALMRYAMKQGFWKDCSELRDMPM